MSKPSLAISTPVPLLDTSLGPRLPFVTLDWHRARLDLQLPMGHECIDLRIEGLPADDARQQVAEKAVELGIKYLFFLDWDVLVPPQGLRRLVELLDDNPDWDVVSGCYTTRDMPPTPIVFTSWDSGTDSDWTVGDQLDCVGVPMGCCLIRVSLFDKLVKPWFLCEGHGSEDLYFCRKAKEEAGVKIMLDTALQCGHQEPQTGIIHTLPMDALPWRRWRAKQAAKRSNGEAVHA